MTRVILIDPYMRSKLWHRVSLAMRLRVRHKIFKAIETGNDVEALRLATKRILLGSKGEFAQSPLVEAINCGRTGLVREFLSLGGMYPGDGAIARAAMRSDLEVVQMFA